MFAAIRRHLHGFLTAAPVNLALVMGVAAFPDHAWDIIVGTGTFLATILVLSLPFFSRPRRRR
jgi:hypothetical protein